MDGTKPRKEVMNKKPTAKYYVDNNDFPGAVERFENSNKQWKNHWWSVCETIFNSCAEWARKYVLDPVARTISAIKKRGRPSKAADKIIWNCPPFTDKGHRSYLVEFLDKKGNILFSKVGSFDRMDKSIEVRFKSELKEYEKLNVEKVRVNRVYNTEFPGEGLESIFRGFYVRKWPDAFQPKDRFIDRVFDLFEADELAAQYG